jgi:hypothetical protein
VRRRLSTVLGLSASLAGLVVAIAVSGAAAKSSRGKTKVHCTATAYNVSYPQLSGLALGVLKCSKPFGNGLQKATNTTSVTGTTVNVTGAFTNYFANGTNRGTIKLTGTIGSGQISVSGPLRITGGTGAYKHMKGSGNVTCTTTDAGKTFNCTVNGTGTL